jgi:transposase
MAGDLPECWIPPAHMLEARAIVRLYKDLLDERGGWHQRIAATLFHQGVPAIGSMATAEGRAAVEQADLSPAGRQAVQAGLRQIDRLTGELDLVRRQLGILARRQPGCRALRDAWFGVGPVTAVAIWAELGDVRRFGNSGDVVRHTGLDITVYSSDTKRSAGHLSRQGPPLLRWALYEAAKSAARTTAPDHGYYTAVRDQRTAGLATLSVARKLARRCYHTLRELGEEALDPAA